MNISWEWIICPVCEHKEYTNFMACKDFYFFYPEEFNLVKCKNCNCIYLNPRPKEEFISYFYPETYNLQEEHIEPFNRIKMRINDILSYKKLGSVLDIGCGTGALLYHLEKLGFKVYGIDISERHLKYGREKFGLKNLVCENLIESNLPESYFDFITLYHTIEHLYQPIKYLEKIFKLLKTNGILIIAIPNCNSLQAKLFQDYWSGWDPPRHLIHFNKRTLSILLKKQGFKILKVSYDYDSKWAFIESMRRFILVKLLPNYKKSITKVGERLQAKTSNNRLKVKIKWILEVVAILFVNLEKLVNLQGCINVHCIKDGE